jgi:hypothetical protein
MPWAIFVFILFAVLFPRILKAIVILLLFGSLFACATFLEHVAALI